MRRPIVRLSSLQLTNIKNVKKGTIYMPNTVNKILSADKAEILGIYGQNGIRTNKIGWNPGRFLVDVRNINLDKRG